MVEHFSCETYYCTAAEVRPEAQMAGSIYAPMHGESSASLSAGKDGCKTAASKQHASSDFNDCLTKGGKDNTSTCAVGQREEGCRVRPAPEQLQHSRRAVGLHIKTQTALDMKRTPIMHRMEVFASRCGTRGASVRAQHKNFENRQKTCVGPGETAAAQQHGRRETHCRGRWR